MVLVYTKNSCPACDALKAALARAGLTPYAYFRNVDTDANARAALFRLGAQSVPAADAGGRAIAGIDAIVSLVRARR